MIACYCNANMTKKIEIVAYFFRCHFHFLVLDSMCVFFGEVHRVLTSAVKLGCWSKQLNHDNTIFPPHLSVLPCCYDTVNDTTLSSHRLVSPIGAIEWPIKHLTEYHIEGGWLEDGLLWKQGLMGVFRSSAICDLHKASEWVISVQVLRGGERECFWRSLEVWLSGTRFYLNESAANDLHFLFETAEKIDCSHLLKALLNLHPMLHLIIADRPTSFVPTWGKRSLRTFESSQSETCAGF